MGSKVLMGMPGPWAHDYREPADPYTSKVGGLPDWPLPKEAINPDFLHCSLCATKLCLVAQVYAPISLPNLHIQQRLLLVFGCLTPNCGISSSHCWRVLRVQKIHELEDKAHETCSHHEEEAAAAESSTGVRNADVSKDLNDDVESDDDVDLAELSKALFASSAASASNSNTKKKKKPKKRQQHRIPATPVDIDTPVVPCFYLYTQEESASMGITSVCSSYSSLSINENKSDVEDHSQAEETWEKEDYEYDRSLTAGRTYLKFKKRLDAYPGQCFRYSYGGKPILAADAEMDPGRCRHCGRPRQFEMQLMPPLLYFLQEALDDDHSQMIENWEWMTLIVFTCSESCYEKIDQPKSNSKGWIVAQEAVVAQHEESMPIQLAYFS